MAVFRYPVLKHEVIDGDSVRVWIDRGWSDTKKIICRLHNIDSPEIRNAKSDLERRAAIAVKNAVERWLAVAGVDELETTSLDKGDWVGRYWGDLHRKALSLSSNMLHYGIVMPYQGQRREWTDEQLTEIEDRSHRMR